jgi:hypothetical protein
MSVSRASLKTLRKLGEPIEVNIPPVEVGMYSGEMENGVPHGRGLMIYSKNNPNRWQKYEGEFKNGIREGKGKMTYSYGDYYEGEFKNWARDGYGEYYYNSSDSIYKGQFRYNVKHGKGILTKKNGVVMNEGIWDKNVFVERKFPETVVLAVSMHGGYDVVKDGERTIDIQSFPFSSLSEELKNPVTDEMFQDLTKPIKSLRTITASAVGVAFYLKPDSLSKYIETIKTYYDEFRDELDGPHYSSEAEKEKQELLDIVQKGISLSLKHTDKERIYTRELLTRNSIKRKSVTKEEEEELTEEKDSFIYHSDKMYWTRTYRSDIPSQSTIKDKEFVKDNGEIELQYDNRINVLNLPGIPDLLDPVEFPEFGIERKRVNRVFIHEIVQYLYSQGVNNVILVDFTCSHCDFGNTSPRTTRKLRRLFGGRKKKTLKKTTTLRRKKSRTV